MVNKGQASRATEILRKNKKTFCVLALKENVQDLKCALLLICNLSEKIQKLPICSFHCEASLLLVLDCCVLTHKEHHCFQLEKYIFDDHL